MTKTNLKRARRLAESGRIDPRVRAALEAHDPGVFDRRARGGWSADADRMIAIRVRLGRFPSAASHDAEIAASGRWWVNRRQEFMKGMLDPARASYLDTHCPGWVSGNSRHWTAEYDEHLALWRRLTRFPPTTSDDDELAMSGRWWNSRRYEFKNGRLDPVRVAYLDEHCPGWVHGNAGPWPAEYDRHLAIRQRLGKFPPKNSTIQELAASGNWWGNRRQELKTGKLDPARAAYLDEHAPGWCDGNRSEPTTRRKR